MAYDAMVTGLAKTGETLLELNPVPWWDRELLMKDDRFTLKQETSSYTDYAADFNLDDMRALHEHFRPYATQGVYEDELWQEQIQPMMKELDEALYEQADRYDHFHVLVYEWESGF